MTPAVEPLTPAATREKFHKWVRASGGSIAAAGRLGISRAYVDMIVNGDRRPGLRLAHSIERATAGQIAMQHWVEPPAEVRNAA